MNYLVIGGSNGIGAALVNYLSSDEGNNIIICDKVEPIVNSSNISYVKIDLFKEDISKIKKYIDESDAIIYTSGIGRVDYFKNFTSLEIKKNIQINLIAFMDVVSLAYGKLASKNDFKMLCISSIAGLVSSPLFSVYSASKAGMCKFVEAVNTELRMSGSNNLITNIVATSFKGTSFNGNKTDLNILENLANEIIESMEKREELHFINADLVNSILDRYTTNPKKFSNESFQYKIDGNRINEKKQYKIGYLSGTFDLFHIGHLNLLRRAKEYCDYLIVGVHKDASHKGKETFISFEERVEIVKSIKYVDEVIQSFKEDCDAWDVCHFDYLFVGSDYKGTERFNHYEDYFKDKGVKIIYFPYTKGTSSTKLRNALEMKSK